MTDAYIDMLRPLIPLIAAAGGIDVIHLPPSCGNARRFILSDGSFAISRLTVERLVDAGYLVGESITPSSIRDGGRFGPRGTRQLAAYKVVQ